MDNREARRLFEKAIEIDQGFARAHAGIAITYLHDLFLEPAPLDFKDIIDTGHRAVELENKDFFTHYALGMAYAVARQPNNAISELEECLRINPNFAQGQVGLGFALFHSGNTKDGIPRIEQAIRLSPSDPFMGLFFQNLARAYLYAGHDEEAVEWAQKAIRKNAHWPAIASLISALSHLGRDDEARQAYEELEQSQTGISVEFVRNRITTTHQPSVERLLDGLRMAGLPES